MKSGPLLKPSEKKKLTSSRYDVLKNEIRLWWKDRLKIGEALREIRDDGLYKSEYNTFEGFCTAEFNLKHSQAYGLIAAVGVKESIKVSAIAERIGQNDTSVSERITNEAQARALAKVPIENRAQVITEASRLTGTLTAKRIIEVAKSRPSDEKKPLDKLGYVIPGSIESDWREAETFRETLNALHRIKLRIEKAIEDRELAFREITNSTVADLHNAWSNLERVLPYAVCPTCEGHNRKNCTLCKQRGWVSRFGYEHWVPKTTRALREKAVK